MKLKQQIHARKQARTGRSQAPVKASWKRPLLLALTALLVGGATWAFCEFVLWNKVPSELVGKWVVNQGPDKGSTIDFSRNGTMITKINNVKLEGIFEIEARIRVQGKKIHCTIRNQETGEEGTRVQTIKALDETHLVLEDERGMSVKLERAK